MVVTFCITFAIAAALLYIPGCSLFRSLRFSWGAAIACAPLASIGVLAVCGVVLQKAGVLGAVPVLVAYIAAVFALVMLFGLLNRSKRFIKSQNSQHASKNAQLANSKTGSYIFASVDWKWFIPYALVGVTVLIHYYLKGIGGLDTCIQEYGDNNYHVAVIQAMIQSGNFSTLAVSAFSGAPAIQIPYGGPTYYPAGWHVVTALAASFSGAVPALAENAVNVLFGGVVFPVGVAAIMQTVFRDNKIMMACGLVTVMACVAFPYRMLVCHQPYPFYAACACIPLMVLCFMGIFRNRASYFGPSEASGNQVTEAIRPNRAIKVFDLFRGPGIAAFFIGVVGIALIHPSALFASVVFWAVFVVAYVIPGMFSQEETIKKWACIVVVSAVAIIIWAVCLKLPFLSSVTNYLWTWTVSPSEALQLLFSLSLVMGSPQYFLSALALIGTAACLMKQESRWLAIAALGFGLIFFFNACGNPDLKHFFAGFWYTDPERSAAFVAIAIAPLSAAGVACTIHGFIKVCSVGALRNKEKGYVSRGLAFVLSAVLLLSFTWINYKKASYLPDEQWTAYGTALAELENELGPLATGLTYTEDEESFIERVISVVGKDPLIINMSFDGSMYAYSCDDLNVYYKTHTQLGSKETHTSEVIRTKLYQLANNEEVKNAVQETGAQYVLKLHLTEESSYDTNKWNPEEWEGITNITDTTPGFEVVLSQGDLRLYRIVA